MPNSPLITVYITNYNYGRFIEESIKSVLGQTIQDYELLIIDDGSTDNSRELIEKYRDYPNVSIVYQKNKGLNVTNNIALRTAKGKYIMRLDADDYIVPDALEIMSAILEADFELGLVFPNYYYVDANGNITGEEVRHNFEKEVALFDQPAHGACTMIRRSFLIELGGYNESFTCQDGYDLWIKFITNHKVTNVSKPLFYYRRHGNNLTTNEKRILDTRKQIKDHFLKTSKKVKRTSVAIIPVRSSYIGDINWPLYEMDGITILERIINVAMLSDLIDYIIITSSEDEIIQSLKSKNIESDTVKIIHRPEMYSRVNETLKKTYIHILNELSSADIFPEIIVSLSLEYPFINNEVINDAINTLLIFEADSLISVRPDNRTYYQHSGHGMTPILDQDKFAKLEREALYKGAGGVVITKVDTLIKNENILHGKVGHIVVNEQEAFGVFSIFDFEIFKSLINEKVVTVE